MLFPIFSSTIASIRTGGEIMGLLESLGTSVAANYISGELFQGLAAWKDMRELQQFMTDLNNWIVEFERGHDGTIAAKGAFDGYIKNFCIVDKVISYVVIPDTEDKAEQAFLSAMSDEVIKGIENKLSRKLSPEDRGIILNFLDTLLSKVKDFIFRNLPENHKDIHYDIFQSRADISELKSIMQKACEDRTRMQETLEDIRSKIIDLGNCNEKCSQPHEEQPQNKLSSEPLTPLGYFISIGLASCRLFEVRDKKTLHESKIVSYEISDPLDNGYFDGIISHIKNDILPCIKEKPAILFTKVFVDYNFSDIFEQLGESSIKDNFIVDFYQQTGLCFNLLTKSQTLDNLSRLFGNIEKNTAIIDINSRNFDIVYFSGTKFHIYNLPVTLHDVKEFVKQKNYPEVWTEPMIKSIKNYILKIIGSEIDGIKVDSTIIIKDELSFMKRMHYPLKQKSRQPALDQLTYQRKNRELLFSIDYKSKLKKENYDKTTFERFYNFKYGHILIETLLEKMKNKTVFPKNEHSIHGSGSDAYISYIFNVVVSGSTHNGRDIYISQACNRLKEMGATVLSPLFEDDGKLIKISANTQQEHLQAIRECDLLFVCNKDNGYIGETTKCEIYFAHALYKPIAFWLDPPEDDRISFIPKEHWGSIMSLNKN